MEKLEVFECVKPQGIKGELKVKVLADDAYAVSKIKVLNCSNGKDYSVGYIKPVADNFAFLKLNEISTRNDSELMRGTIFYADKNAIIKDKNAYFIKDLIGLDVFSDGDKIGVITDVIKSNVDMIKVLLIGGNIAYFPHLKVLNPKVDLPNKKFVVDGEKLKDVIYYEN